MIQKITGVLFAILFSVPFLYGQPWIEAMQDASKNVYTVEQLFKQEWKNKPYERGYGYKQYMRWAYFWMPRVHPHGNRFSPGHIKREFNDFKSRYAHTFDASRNTAWKPLGPSSWTRGSYNPGIGRINAVAQALGDTNTLYIGAPAGGCWKSTDAGQTWAALTDDFPALGVSSIAIDPTDKNIVYIGTGDDDGNDTQGAGMYRTADGGQTWNEVQANSAILFGASVNKIIIDPNNNKVIWAASSTGCYKSEDSGLSWTLLIGGAWRDMEMHPTNPSIVYLTNKDFYKTEDGGLNWIRYQVGLPTSQSINRAEIAVSAATPDVIYYLCGEEGNSSFYGLYKSTNKGASFTLRANSPNLFDYSKDGSDASRGQSNYDMALAVSPTNANEVYVGGINVWKSSDGGGNWVLQTHWALNNNPTHPYVHADIHTIDFFGNNLYVGSDGGISRSTNAGSSFQDLSPGVSISQFYHFDVSAQNPYLLSGGTQDNGSNLIRNGNAHHIRGGDGMYNLISPDDSMTLYSSAQFGGFSRSRNGGNGFRGIFKPWRGNGPWVTPMAINPQNTKTVYALFNSNLIVSYNEGDTTSILGYPPSNPRSYALLEMCAGDTMHFYTGDRDNLMHSGDYGQTWQSIMPANVSAAPTDICVHPTKPGYIWITFSGIAAGQKVFGSIDTGKTWTNLSKNLPNIPINCIAVDTANDNMLYVGTDAGVYYASELSHNWQPHMNGLPNVIVRDIIVTQSIGKVRAATYGRGIWEAALKTSAAVKPTANFSANTSAAFCSTDSVVFTNTSLALQTKWTWSFPDGVPASSNQENPKVAYPRSGNYVVTLVTENSVGKDTITKTITINQKVNKVQLSVQFDNIPLQNSWEFKNSNGVVVFDGVGAISDSNSLKTYDYCLDEGCYTFSFFDYAFNGLNGYFLLTDNLNDTLGYLSNFTGYVQNVLFCVDEKGSIQAAVGSTESSCGNSDGIIDVAYIYGGSGTYYCSIDGGQNFFNQTTFTQLTPALYDFIIQDAVTGTTKQFFVDLRPSNAPIAVASASQQGVNLNQNTTVSFYGTNSTNASSYTWYLPDGTTANGSSSSFNFTQPGTYDIILEAQKANCSDFDTLNIVVNNGSGVYIRAVEDRAIVNVSPNPVEQFFTLAVELKAQGPLEVVIHDATGKKVYWQLFEDQIRLKERIHFGNQPAGVYTLSIRVDAEWVTQSFIKR